jgi:hypothetical protein
VYAVDPGNYAQCFAGTAHCGAIHDIGIFSIPSADYDFIGLPRPMATEPPAQLAISKGAWPWAEGNCVQWQP